MKVIIIIIILEQELICNTVQVSPKLTYFSPGVG